ncbi:MAG: low molecular weight phosphotyrosine protein phosphatase [Sphingomonas sp.]|nr:low molecular weight phosphotyrosine protein phosphatase [Sphingomonas sp.]
MTSPAILFVCLGNICRSPLAEAAFRSHGVDISRYRGRQVEAADFRRFSHIFALDLDNLAALRRIEPADATAKIGLLLDLVDGMEGQAVADPYYGPDEGFEETWEQVDRAALALVAQLGREHG